MMKLVCVSVALLSTLVSAVPVADYAGHGHLGHGHGHGHLGFGGHGFGHGFHGGHGDHHGGHHHHHHPSYGFQYGVHDPHHGANFGHQEERDGYTTRGSYYVNLPDGRLQRVDYIADEHGYRPLVSYEGEAHYPSHGHGYHGHGHHGHGHHGHGHHGYHK